MTDKEADAGAEVDADTVAAEAQGETQDKATEQKTTATETDDKAGKASLAEGGDGATGKGAAPAYWPEDWRQKVAEQVGGTDPKAVKRELKRLERFTDPNGIYAMSRELESKFTSGNLIRKPGKNAKPDEIAEYHKHLGVPDQAEDYLKDLKLENGAVIGDEDRPVLKSFAEAAHKSGTPPESARGLINWYYGNLEAQAAELDKGDDAYRTESKNALKEEWGPAYERYTNGIQSLYAFHPRGEEGIHEILAGRDANGHIIGDNPDVVRLFAALSREINPVASVVEGGGNAKTAENRLAEIRALRSTDKKVYFSDKVQAEELELIAALDKQKNRG